MELLRVENLDKVYSLGNNKVHALNDVSFSISKGEIVAIMGSSGSGKSTLLNVLGALDSPDKGKVYFDNVYLKNYHKEPDATNFRSEMIGFIFQGFNLLKDLNVEENIALPLILQGESKEDIEKKVEENLEIVGLSRWRKHRITELSGGQQQRVCIARAIITNPEILLADEPTGNLDHNTSIEILNTFLDMREKLNQSIIIVTHDPVVASYADRILFFKDGSIVEDYKRKGKCGEIDTILSKFKEVIN